MTADATATPAPPTPEVAQSIHLLGVHTIKFAAERYRSGVSPRTEFSFSQSYSADEPPKLIFRFDLIGRLMELPEAADPPEDEQPLALIENSIIVEYQLGEDVDVAGTLDVFARSSAMIVMPYLREAASTLGQRIGQTGVTLPLTFIPGGEVLVSVDDSRNR